MTEKICPRCRRDNALENDFCGRCGARLETPVATRPASPLVIGESAWLPAPVVKQAARAAVAGVLALAAEVGLAWLRRREAGRKEPTIIRPTPIRKREAKPPAPTSPGVTIFSRRVIQIWERGRLRSQGVEESVWQWHDEI